MAGSERTASGTAPVGLGRSFYKMSGSGNDFVTFDMIGKGSEVALPGAELVRRLCRRGEGVGADGLLVLTDDADADYRVVYYNADGARAELCGNASLCSVRLAVELGHVAADGVSFVTDAGRMTGRLVEGRPEIDLPAPTGVADDRRELWEAAGGVGKGEHRIGFARVGVPHLVLLCDSVDEVEIVARGPGLRHHPALADGANVNFVSSIPGRPGEWAMRTFERGVEGETLACGTGAVATAHLLTRWGLAGDGSVRSGSDSAATSPSTPTAGGSLTTAAAGAVRLRARSGCLLRVTFREVDGEERPSLQGQGRIVYRGELAEL